jgi:hypothetical protein
MTVTDAGAPGWPRGDGPWALLYLVPHGVAVLAALLLAAPWPPGGGARVDRHPGRVLPGVAVLTLAAAAAAAYALRRPAVSRGDDAWLTVQAALCLFRAAAAARQHSAPWWRAVSYGLALLAAPAMLYLRLAAAATRGDGGWRAAGLTAADMTDLAYAAALVVLALGVELFAGPPPSPHARPPTWSSIQAGDDERQPLLPHLHAAGTEGKEGAGRGSPDLRRGEDPAGAARWWSRAACFFTSYLFLSLKIYSLGLDRAR